MALGKFFTAFILPLALSATNALASSVCESQKHFELTLPQQQAALLFYNQLSFLERYRGGPDARGVTYAQKLADIIRRNQGYLNTPRLQEIGVEYLFYEQMRQAVHETIGLSDSSYDQFDRTARSMMFFSSMAPRPLIRASGQLQRRLWIWASSNSGPDAERLRRIAQVEPTVRLIDTVTLNILRQGEQNWQQVNDRLSMYKQVLITALGGTVFFGSVGISGPLVGASYVNLGVAGLVLAGCGLGSTGSGFASVLQNQYRTYANAYNESVKSDTSYSCELRQQVEAKGESLVSEVAGDFVTGAGAGCAFTVAGLVAPAATTWTVVSAVALATAAEGAFAVNDAILARKSYLTYQSLMAYQEAESKANAGDREKAEFYLRQSEILAQKAGAQALDTLLAGVVIPAFARGEIRNALRAGRVAIVALIGKSADNAAVAAQLLAKYANLTSPSSAP